MSDSRTIRNRRDHLPLKQRRRGNLSRRVELIAIGLFLLVLAPPDAATHGQYALGSGHSLDANLRIGSGGYNGRAGGGAYRGRGLRRGAYRAYRGGIDRYNAFLDERAYTPHRSSAGNFPGRIDTRVGAAAPPPRSGAAGSPRQVAEWSPPATGFSEAYDTGYEASLGDSHYESETAQQQANALSYGIGFAIGEEVRTVLDADRVGADGPSVILGFRDAVQKSLPRLSDAEMEELLHALFQRIESERTGERLSTDPEFKAQLGRNKAIGKALHEKLARDAETVTLDNGLQYSVLVAGTGDVPSDTDWVRVSYRLITPEGEYVTEPLEQRIVLRTALEGVRIALTSMKVGGVWRVALPSDLAHGANGSPPHHGPGVTVYFEVELLSID